MKKKYILSILVVILLIPFGGMVIINILFKSSFGLELLEAEWEAGDALSFYGTIVASIIGVLGVFLSIKSAQKDYQEDFKNRVLPYIAVNSLERYNLVNPLIDFPSDEEVNDNDFSNDCAYTEKRLQTIICVISNGKIKYQKNFSQSQKRIIYGNGNTWELDKNGAHILIGRQLILIPLEIENVGNGPAINLTIGFNRQEDSSNERHYIYPQSLKLNYPINIYIYIEDANIEDVGKYILEFRYSDIYENKYYQSNEIIVEENSANPHSFNAKLHFNIKQEKK